MFPTLHVLGIDSKPRLAPQAEVLKAINDFKDRIIPVFSELKQQANQITTMHDDLERCRLETRALKTSLQRVQPLEQELAEVRSALQQTSGQLEQALALAEKASGDLVQSREELQACQTTMEEMEGNVRRYKGQLHGHSDLVNKFLNFAQMEVELTWL